MRAEFYECHGMLISVSVLFFMYLAVFQSYSTIQHFYLWSVVYHYYYYYCYYCYNYCYYHHHHHHYYYYSHHLFFSGGGIRVINNITDHYFLVPTHLVLGP